MSDNTDTTKTLAGVLIPDYRCRVNSSSVITEADPYPGPAVPGRRTRMALTAGGSPASTDTIDILTTRGGYAGSDGAQVAYRRGSTGEYIGRDYPISPRGYEPIAWTQSPSTTTRSAPQCVTLKDGVIFAAYVEVVSTVPATYKIQTRTISKDGAIGSVVTAFSKSSSSDITPNFGMLVLPDNTVEIYYLAYTSGAAQIDRLQSLDGGATWTKAGRNLLDLGFTVSALDQNPDVVRCAYLNGQLALSVRTVTSGTSTAYLYGSINLTRFKLHSQETDRIYEDITTDGGFFILVESNFNASTLYSLNVRRSPDVAFLAGSVAVGISSLDNHRPYACVFSSGSGVTIAHTTVGGVNTRQSFDSGQTFNGRGLLAASDFRSFAWRSSATATGDYEDGAPVNMSAAYADGRAVMVAQPYLNGALSEGSIIAIQLGAQTNVTQPLPAYLFPGVQALLRQAPWKDQVMTYQDPVDFGFTEGAVGTPTVTISGGSLEISTAAGEVKEYKCPTLTGPNETLAILDVEQTTAGGGYVFLRLATDNTAGTGRFDVSIRLNAGTVRLGDNNSGTELGSETGFTGRVLLALGLSPDGQVCGWAKSAHSSLASDQSMVKIGPFTGLTTSAIGDRLAAFGSNGSSVANFRFFASHNDDQVTLSTLINNGWSDGIPLENLSGVPVTNRQTLLTDTTTIRGRGLARVGDSWTITPSADYAAEQALPSYTTSPRRPWRTTDTVSQSLVIDLGTGDQALGSPVLGLYMGALDGVSIVTVEAETGGVYSTLGTASAAIPGTTGITWSIIGSSVRADYSGSASAAQYFIERDELTGGIFVDSNGNAYTIIGNTSGQWDNGQGVKVTIHLDPDQVLAMALTAGGDAQIFAPRLLFIAHLSSQNFRALRLTFDATIAPPKGYFEVGTLAAGSVQILGAAPNENRARALSLGQRIDEIENGERSHYREQPDRKRVEVSWTRVNPGDLSQARQHEYTTSTTAGGAIPAANSWGSPLDIRGIISEQGRSPLVFLPSIDYGDGSTATQSYALQFANGATYGRYVGSSYRMESITGAPHSGGEAVRVATITIEEET